MGGVQFSTVYLAQSLDRGRWRSVVLAPAEGDLIRVSRNAGIETQIVSQRRMWSTSLRLGRRFRLPNPFAWLRNSLEMRRAARRLARVLQDLSPDLIVTKGMSAHFVGGKAARKLGVPCVWHLQDQISERTFGIYRRIFGLAARWLPTEIIADGVAIKNQLPKSLWSKTTVIHNGVDVNVFRPDVDGSGARGELGIPTSNIVIGHAARVTPWKGQHYLIEAFARIANQHPHTSLLFVGSPVFDHDAYERRLRSLAAELGLVERIKFAGYRHDLAGVLASMDIFAFTSIEKDTSPLALLSAMSSGLPIVAFDIDGVRELVDDDKQLLRVPAGDVQQLADALVRVMSDDALRAAMAQSSRQLAETKFSLEQYVQAIEGVLLRMQSRPTREPVEQQSLNVSAGTPVIGS